VLSVWSLEKGASFTKATRRQRVGGRLTLANESVGRAS
jgi:hypothetical protein